MRPSAAIPPGSCGAALPFRIREVNAARWGAARRIWLCIERAMDSASRLGHESMHRHLTTARQSIEVWAEISDIQGELGWRWPRAGRPGLEGMKQQSASWLLREAWVAASGLAPERRLLAGQRRRALAWGTLDMRVAKERTLLGLAGPGRRRRGACRRSRAAAGAAAPRVLRPPSWIFRSAAVRELVGCRSAQRLVWSETKKFSSCLPQGSARSDSSAAHWNDEQP